MKLYLGPYSIPTLISLNCQHMSIFGVFTTSLSSGHGFVYVLTLEIMQFCFSTKVLKMVSITPKMLNTSEYFYGHVEVAHITKTIAMLPASFVSGCGQSFFNRISTLSWSLETEFQYVKTRESQVHQACHETMHSAYQQSGMAEIVFSRLMICV